ncbi:MAG: hypothetical protein ACRC0G_02425 [Fusobacteriaceae bacterium]
MRKKSTLVKSFSLCCPRTNLSIKVKYKNGKYSIKSDPRLPSYVGVRMLKAYVRCMKLSDYLESVKKGIMA